MLPGDGDAAVHLRVEVGAEVGGRRGQRGGHRGGVGELVAAGGGGARGVPHGGGGHLGGHDHVGAVVLHGLVHGDDPAELDALLRVGGGQLGALARQGPTASADRITRGRSTSVRAAPGRTVAGAPSRVTRAERRVGSRLGGTSTSRRRRPRRRRRRRPRPRAARGRAAAEHRAGGAGGGAAGDRDVAAEGDGAERGAVGEAGEPAAPWWRRRRPRRWRRWRWRSARTAPGPRRGRGPRPRRRAPRCRSRSRRAPRGGGGPASPRPVSAFQKEGSSSVGASRRARAAPRASCLARKSAAVSARARWSSVMAIDMAGDPPGSGRRARGG